MIAVQLGSSTRIAWFLLVVSGLSALMFGGIAIALGDWIAAGFAVASLIGAARVGLVLVRRHRLQASANVVAGDRAFVGTVGDALFVSFAHFVVGARVRQGVVLIGPSLAIFIPVGRWSHLAWQLIAAPFVTEFRFVDLAIEPDAGDIDGALRDGATRHGGFVIDHSWTYSHQQRWLYRAGKTGIVWIERTPPASITARWAAMPPPSAERYRSVRNRVGLVAAAIVIGLMFAGIVAWRLTGDADYLIAALVYALLIGGGLVAGVIVAKRRFAIDLDTSSRAR